MCEVRNKTSKDPQGSGDNLNFTNRMQFSHFHNKLKLVSRDLIVKLKPYTEKACIRLIYDTNI